MSERIRWWEDGNDAGLKEIASKSKLRKIGQKKIGRPIQDGGKPYFERFQASNGWSYLELAKEHQPLRLSGDNILEVLETAKVRGREDLEFDDFSRALRNSFAHGGVLPKSSRPTGGRTINSGRAVGDSQEIDRVYFVSKWSVTSWDNGKEVSVVKGLLILEFSVDALEAFWNDWRDLILGAGSDVLKQIDRVA